MRTPWRRAAEVALVATASTAGVAGCRVETEITPVASAGSTEGDTSTGSGSDGSGSESTAATDDGSDTGGSTGDAPVDPGPWAPGVVYPSTREPDARGYLDLRGPLHTHTPYSHDACDGEPWDADGVTNAPCMNDLRTDLCKVQHDFAFLTDHPEAFADTEFPTTLLYDPDRGDVLVERGGGPVASWAGCEDAAATLVMAGCESELMPVGLEGHAPGRAATYGDPSAAAIAELTATGALTFVAHTEDWAPQTLVDLPLHGFEMYNLHANTLLNAGAALVLLAQRQTPELLPHSDLILMPIFSEDPRYLERWGTVLASGARRVTTMGTDAHRNTFPELLPDGERVDSFRRMLQWFSNHVRVQPEADGTWDDRHVKAAVAAGRLYGAFEYMGYPEGFDAYATAGGETFEIGAEMALADAPELTVVRPAVRNLDPEVDAPGVELRILRARDGGFDEVATGTDATLTYAPTTAGAYRVEVRIVPHHLRDWLGSYDDLADESRPWIYANPFYVTE